MESLPGALVDCDNIWDPKEISNCPELTEVFLNFQESGKEKEKENLT